MKQVGKFCREHGILVTLVGNVSASGTALPPFFVFPRVNFKDYMLGNAKPFLLELPTQVARRPLKHSVLVSYHILSSRRKPNATRRSSVCLF